MDAEQLRAAGALIIAKDGAAHLSVHVQPGAKTTEWVGMHGDRLKLRLQAPPVDGKANKELVAWAAAHFDVPRAAVTIVRGQTSRRKTLRIELP